MIRKWVVLNIGITILVVVLIGVSISEFACYQFNQYTDSALQSHHFRKVVEGYLIGAGLLVFIAAVLIHLFFAKKILTPLHKLSDFSKVLNHRFEAHTVNVTSTDEVGQIADDLKQVSNRMNDLNQQQNQMMAGLAHELRTPLTNLNGYLEGLEAGVFDQNESIYALLKNECVQLTSLVESMREFQQWENGEIKKQWVEMKDAIPSATAPYQSQFDELGIELEMRVNPSRVYGDPQAIYAILGRLLDNVVQFDVGKNVKVEGYHLHDDYVISVSNKGLPIPEDAESHLFEPFFRVEDSRNRETGGSGLGLAIVKEIVDELNGEAGFYTEEHVHTFWCSFPVINGIRGST